MKDVMNVTEVAEYLGFATSKINRLIHDKKIPASRIDRRIVFLKAAVDEWMQKNQIDREDKGVNHE